MTSATAGVTVTPATPHLPTLRPLVFRPMRSTAALQQIDAQTGAPITLCTGPCDTYVPIGEAYRVGGVGVADSRAFVLLPGGVRWRHGASRGRYHRLLLEARLDQPIVVESQDGSMAGILGGFALGLGGGGVALAGGLLRESDKAGTTGDIAGAAMLASGTTMVAISLLLFFLHETRLSFRTRPAPIPGVGSGS